MPSYVICGGTPLKGELKIQGSKNAVLPLMAAAILNKGTTILHNCPEISDVSSMEEALIHIGCVVSRRKKTIIIDASAVNNDCIPEKKVKKTRASMLLIGAMLGRTGKVIMGYPGGCMIGARPVDFHLKAFKDMNVQVVDRENEVECSGALLTGNSIRLPFPSVGATENIILAAAKAKGVTRIINAAKEPEVCELCTFLIAAGAEITGAGTGEIVIKGVKGLHDSEYSVSSDRIAAGTYACAAVSTRGSICCRLSDSRLLCGITEVFTKMGCGVRSGNDYLEIVSSGRPECISYLRTEPYPGFPTDMQSQVAGILALANGRSVIEETVFEKRFHIVSELAKLGADIAVADERRIIINGVEAFEGTHMNARELRGGAALIAAGLSAEGTSVVEDTGFIERGYEDIVGNFVRLGGNIQFEKD